MSKKRAPGSEDSGLHKRTRCDTSGVPGCNIYPPGALEFSAKAVLAQEELQGLDLAKERLEKEIALPFQNPEYYDVDSSFFGKTLERGKIPIDREFVLFGPRGVGKKSLLFALCRHLRLTLIHIDPLRFDPLEHLNQIYDHAIAEKSPALVLLDQCEGYFGEKSPGVGRLKYNLDRIKHNCLPIWTIFTMSRRPEELHWDVRPPSKNSFRAGALNSAERELVFKRAISLLRYDTQTELPLDSRIEKRMLTASLNCTPNDIHLWVQKVFKRALLNNCQEIGVKKRDDILFLPTNDDFKVLLDEGADTITEFNAESVNVAPFLEPEEMRRVRQVSNFASLDKYGL